MKLIEKIRAKVAEYNVRYAQYLDTPQLPGLRDEVKKLKKEIDGLREQVQVIIPERSDRVLEPYESVVARVLLQDGVYGSLVTTEKGMRIRIKDKLVNLDDVDYVIAQPEGSSFKEVPFRPVKKKPKKPK